MTINPDRVPLGMFSALAPALAIMNSLRHETKIRYFKFRIAVSAAFLPESNIPPKIGPMRGPP